MSLLQNGTILILSNRVNCDTVEKNPFLVVSMGEWKIACLLGKKIPVC